MHHPKSSLNNYSQLDVDKRFCVFWQSINVLCCCRRQGHHFWGCLKLTQLRDYPFGSRGSAHASTSVSSNLCVPVIANKSPHVASGKAQSRSLRGHNNGLGRLPRPALRRTKPACKWHWYRVDQRWVHRLIAAAPPPSRLVDRAAATHWVIQAAVLPVIR